MGVIRYGCGGGPGHGGEDGREVGFGHPGGFCVGGGGFLGEHAVVEGVGVHLDGLLDRFGTRVAGEVAEGFEEALLIMQKTRTSSAKSSNLSTIPEQFALAEKKKV